MEGSRPTKGIQAQSRSCSQQHRASRVNITINCILHAYATDNASCGDMERNISGVSLSEQGFVALHDSFSAFK